MRVLPQPKPTSKKRKKGLNSKAICITDTDVLDTLKAEEAAKLEEELKKERKKLEKEERKKNKMIEDERKKEVKMLKNRQKEQQRATQKAPVQDAIKNVEDS